MKFLNDGSKSVTEILMTGRKSCKVTKKNKYGEPEAKKSPQGSGNENERDNKEHDASHYHDSG